MAGSVIPVVVAHGEGRVGHSGDSPYTMLRYVDNYHRVTEAYPFNPNGSHLELLVIALKMVEFH